MRKSLKKNLKCYLPFISHNLIETGSISSEFCKNRSRSLRSPRSELLKGVGYGIQFTRNLVNSISKELAIIMHWQKPLNVLKK